MRITDGIRPRNLGWVTERSIVHAWKACVLKSTRGSNPRPSATSLGSNLAHSGLLGHRLFRDIHFLHGRSVTPAQNQVLLA